MYKDYVNLFANLPAHFGGTRSRPDATGAFSLRVATSSAYSSETIGGRLIMFGD